jgi:hypothetical protein
MTQATRQTSSRRHATRSDTCGGGEAARIKETIMSFRSVLVLAGILTASATSAASPSPGGEEACNRIVAACKAAGFAEDSKEKNLERDCVGPILSGVSVSGVTVIGSDVAACKEFRTPKPKR